MTTETWKRWNYTEDFKRDTVALVTEQIYKPLEAARSLCIGYKLICRWEQEWTGDRLYKTRQAAIADVREYVAVYYNSKRLHSTLVTRHRWIMKKLLTKCPELVDHHTHVNYSARVQTVHEDTNPRYYHVIKEFNELTGCPVLVIHHSTLALSQLFALQRMHSDASWVRNWICWLLEMSFC